MVHAAAIVSAVPSGLDPRKDCAEDSAHATTEGIRRFVESGKKEMRK